MEFINIYICREIRIEPRTDVPSLVRLSQRSTMITSLNFHKIKIINRIKFIYMNRNFREQLAQRQEKIGSVLCVGLDPTIEKIPERFNQDRPVAKNVLHWMIWVVDETSPYTSMYKPNRAFWESIPKGEDALKDLIKYIKGKYPDIIIFDDVKRGDIGNTQNQYRIAHFEIDGADGINFSPYMGRDCLEGLFDSQHPGRSIVSLCYTSNPAAREIQDATMENGDKLWEFIAKKNLEWTKELGIENAGLVMAAAYEPIKGSGTVYSEHLSRCREIVGSNFWFLIPGVGTQGGFLEQTIKASFTGWGSIAINSSSGIIFSENPKEAAQRLHLEMNYTIQDLKDI